MGRMKFRDIRETVLKTGEPLSDILKVVDSVTAEKHPDAEFIATPRMKTLDPLSPERPYPDTNRRERRGELKGRAGRWNLNGFEQHWRRDNRETMLKLS